MTEVEKAWLAGIVDSDGCIFVWRRTSKKARTTFVCGFCLQTRDKLMVPKVSELTGVAYYTKKARAGMTNVISPGPNDSYRIIKAIEPYLVVKREQAKLVILFHEKYKSIRPAPDHYYKAQEEIHYKLKQMKEDLKL